MSKSSMEIIRAGEEHLEAIAPLFDAYRVFYERPSDPGLARDFIGERLRNADSVIFLALGSGPTATPLGFTQLYPSFSSVAAKRHWILNDLFVAPEGRRRGVGRALLERARQHARETGARGLGLATAITNTTAQALYESVGYIRDEVFYHYDQIV